MLWEGQCPDSEVRINVSRKFRSELQSLKGH